MNNSAAGYSPILRREPRKQAIGAALALAASILLAGCTTVLEPPANVKEPITVLLLDQGRTSSLVLPDGHGGMTRWAYGDWDWYALRKTDLYHGIAALFWPTQGALGRKHIEGTVGPGNAGSRFEVWVENAYAIEVEREAAYRLNADLTQLYEANIKTQVDTPSVGLSFVHHPDAYTAWHNSNHVTATWLSELGVHVHGTALCSVWSVPPPAHSGAAGASPAHVPTLCFAP